MRASDTRRLGVAELHLTANEYVGKLTGPTGAALKGFTFIYNVANPVHTGLMVPLARTLMQQDSYDWFLQNRQALSGSEASHHRSPAKQGILAVAKKLVR